MNKLKNKNDEIESGPYQGRTPLNVAAELGFERLVASLIRHFRCGSY